MGNCLLFILHAFEAIGDRQYFIIYIHEFWGGLIECTERLNRWVYQRYKKHAILIEFHEHVAVWLYVMYVRETGVEKCIPSHLTKKIKN